MRFCYDARLSLNRVYTVFLRHERKAATLVARLEVSRRSFRCRESKAFHLMRQENSSVVSCRWFSSVASKSRNRFFVWITMKITTCNNNIIFCLTIKEHNWFTKSLARNSIVTFRFSHSLKFLIFTLLFSAS